MSAPARLPEASRSAMMPEPITVAASRSEPKPSAAIRLSTASSFRRRLLTDDAQFLSQRHLVQGCDWQCGKELDSGIEFLEGFAERKGFVRIGAFDRGRVSDSPVSGHRLSGPYRTHFAGCVVADRKGKIERR